MSDKVEGPIWVVTRSPGFGYGGGAREWTANRAHFPALVNAMKKSAEPGTEVRSREIMLPCVFKDAAEVNEYLDSVVDFWEGDIVIG